MKRVPTRGDIDRSRVLTFHFDGRRLQGFAGDTLASALLANGVRLVGRSFKYHRPRGIYGFGAEEPNALVSVGTGDDRVPNLQATCVPLKEGLVATSQNRWPSLRWDIQALNQLAGRFLGAGFYYKTFMGPVNRAWMAYEPWIRRAAGLGAPPEGPGKRSQTLHRQVPVLVIGGGLAGLAAAVEGARNGPVLLVEQDTALGGAALMTAQDSRERSALLAMLAEVKCLPNLEVMLGTQAFGAYDHGVFGLVRRGQSDDLIVVETSRSVVATGACERGIALPDNDRPGVMLASAARGYLNRFGVLVGHNIIVFTNNDSALDAAIDLANEGAKIKLVDVRDTHDPTDNARLQAAGVEVYLGRQIVSVVGRTNLQAVILSDGTRFPADVLCLSGGWSPTLHLTSHQGHKPVWSDAHAAFLPDQLPKGMDVAGAVAGDFRPVPTGDATARISWRTPIQPLWRSGKSAHAFVDLQNDVTVKDVSQARDEGFRSIEHLKRYTTLGMGTDQGRLSNVPGLALMAEFTGQGIAQTGVTAFRPPFSAVSLGTLGGDNVGARFHMRRRSPLHEDNIRDGAEMIHSGLWDRPWFYRPNGEDIDTAYCAEMQLVRSGAALCDVSSLGKIDIEGPDAAEFLNRLYSNPFLKLPVGKARWGIMLRDDGYVFDDGTTSRLDEHKFFMTTTTTMAGQVLARMEFLLDTDWQDLRVHVTPVTDQWAAMALAGPQSRDVLEKVCTGDVSNTALPFLGVTDAVSIASVPVRILRVSFSGERSYEIYAPSHDAPRVWRGLREAGAGTEGLEALGALRIEKGHITGAEFDGTTTMDDLGLMGMFSRKKQFVGSVMARREGLMDKGRLQLVGLEGDAQTPLNSGAVLSFGAFEGIGEGRITSATWSPTLGSYIALALLRDGRAHYGREIRVLNPARGRESTANIRDPHFQDPEGGRMRD